MGYRRRDPARVISRGNPHCCSLVHMLTGPVATARAVVATGAWANSEHDMYLIRGMWELKLYFYPSVL